SSAASCWVRGRSRRADWNSRTLPHTSSRRRAWTRARGCVEGVAKSGSGGTARRGLGLVFATRLLPPNGPCLQSRPELYPARTVSRLGGRPEAGAHRGIPGDFHCLRAATTDLLTKRLGVGQDVQLLDASCEVGHKFRPGQT